MNVTFHAFGPAHLAVIVAVPALAAVLAWLQRRFGAGSRVIRYSLAVLLLMNLTAYYAGYALAGEPLFPAHLPLELCDVSVFVVIAVLLTLKPAIFDVAYYWALAGAGNALFTPNFTQAPWFIWVQYFISHGLIVVATLYLIWSRQARPRPGSVARAMLATNLYAVIPGMCDLVYQTNYMYLRDKPPAPTLLNLLGPWPWYIIMCEVMAFVLFYLLYLPFRRLRGSTREEAQGFSPDPLAPEIDPCLGPSASSRDR
jgi:hypothetical integral membrane protein (TIGR02206 family)